MKREFVINLFFLISINLIVKPFYLFGIDLQVQNTVGKAAYGLYFALFNFSFIFQIFTDLGIHQYNNRNIAQHSYLFDKYFSSILLLKGGLSVFFLLFSFLVAVLVGYRGEALHLLFFLLINQVFITLIFFFRSNISGLQHYRLDSFISVLDKLLVILICLPLIYGEVLGPLQIEWFVYAQTIAFGSTALIAFWVVNGYLKKQLRFKWNNKLFRVILRQSIPFALVVLLMTMYTRIDAIMLERLLPNGEKEAGIYAAGYRLLDAANMICFLFAGLLLPMFARMLKKRENIEELLGMSSRIMLVLTLSASVAVCFHATPIMQWLYADYEGSMASVLILLMIGFNAIGVINIIGTLLTANGNLLQMNIVFVIGIVINVISNYFLILWYGAWGAALTTVVTQTFVAIAEYRLAYQFFDLKIRSSFVMQVILFATGVIGINYGLSQLALPWLLLFVLGGLLAVCWAFLTKIIHLQQILAFFKPKSN